MKNTSHENKLSYPFPAALSMAQVMEFVCHPTWRQTVNVSVMKKLRIAAGNEDKVVAALCFRGIINENGAPTEEFDNLKKDYQPTLARLVRQSYAELFDTFPAELITRARLESFLGGSGQVPGRRARFFMWVCGQAGIELPNLDKDLGTKKTVKQQKAEA